MQNINKYCKLKVEELILKKEGVKTQWFFKFDQQFLKLPVNSTRCNDLCFKRTTQKL